VRIPTPETGCATSASRLSRATRLCRARPARASPPPSPPNQTRPQPRPHSREQPAAFAKTRTRKKTISATERPGGEFSTSPHGVSRQVTSSPCTFNDRMLTRHAAPTRSTMYSTATTSTFPKTRGRRSSIRASSRSPTSSAAAPMGAPRACTPTRTYSWHATQRTTSSRRWASWSRR
jgi:hypothetical protein